MTTIGSQIFAYILSKVETPFVGAVTQVMNTFLAFMAAPLKVALVLYVALTGILIIRGECNEPGPLLIGRFLKMGLVVWVLTGTGIYHSISTTFFSQSSRTIFPKRSRQQDP